MRSVDIPTKFPIAFGASAATGTIRTVPVPDQTGITPGAASLTTGFPSVTGQALASGGIPPAMQDFNGLFNQITAWNRWQGAGGLSFYDATFSSTVGGYPQGAILASTTPGIIWLSTADSNTTNPDGSSPTNWVKIYSSTSIAVGGRVVFSRTTAGSYTWTCPANTTLVLIQAVGGGGGGGGGNAYTGAGGLGGNYFQGVFNVTPGTTYTIQVGAGGIAGGGGGGGAPGGNGGSTYIQLSGITPTALGGTGGGSGGNSATGFVGVAGAPPGLSGIVFPYGGFELPGYGAQNGIYLTIGATNVFFGGMGGGAPLFASTTPFPAQNGSFGGTGSGGGGSGGAGASAGGVGAPGAIFITGG